MCPIESIPVSSSDRVIHVSIAQYWFLPRVNRGDRTTTTRDKCSRTLNRSWRTVSVVLLCSSSSTCTSSIASCDEVGNTAKMALKSDSENVLEVPLPILYENRMGASSNAVVSARARRLETKPVAHVTSSDGARCSCCKGGKSYETPVRVNWYSWGALGCTHK